MGSVAETLETLKRGEPRAAEELLAVVYEDLRRLAAHKLARESPGQTLQATALVHEAYLRVVGLDADKKWEHRGHFFMAAAEAMRRILVDNARRKKRLKQGGHLDRADIDLSGVEGPQGDGDLLALEDSLAKLAKEHDRKAKLVELRYFAGLTMEEAAEVLGVSIATAERDWAFARAWLA